MIEVSETANLPTKHGDFDIKVYKQNNQEHLVLMSKNLAKLHNPLVRIHSECLTGDTMGSLKCDCANQLHLALDLIAKEGGMVIYHRQEGRNIGLLNKVNAYALQDRGYNTIEANHKLGFKADERTYEVICSIFADLGIHKVKLITNNPAKIKVVQNCVQITERIPAITQVNKHNRCYLDTKKQQMGHLL
ncbi:MAG: GTP cyclohydrolase II [Campylobacterota bacterium]